MYPTPDRMDQDNSKQDLMGQNKKGKKAEKKAFPLPLWLLVTLSLVLKSAAVLYELYDSGLGQILLYSLYALLPILLFTSFAFLFHEKGQKRYLLFANLVISVILFADAVYARSFGRLPSVHMLGATGVLDGLGQSVFSLLKPTDLFYFLDVVVFCGFGQSRLYRLSPRNTRVFAGVFSVTLAATLVYNSTLDTSRFRGDRNLWPLALSPLGTHFYEMGQIVRDRDVELTDETVETIEEWHEQNAEFLVADTEFEGLEGILQGKNLIVIQVESLENFVIGQEIWGYEITPNINALLDESLYFSNLIEQTADGNSSDAEFLFNTSMYPISSGSTFIRYGDNQYNALPTILANEDYTALAIHGDDKEYWNRDVIFPNMGFADYIDETRFTENSELGMGIDDEALFNESLRLVRQMEEPYYLYLITLTSHMPFELPEEKIALEFPEETIATAYLNAIHYVDEQFGRFYRSLEDSGLVEDTVLVLYGDHEGVHKYYQDTGLPENNGELPFIIHTPGLEGQKVENDGGQIDMLPTLLYLLGTDQTLYQDTVMGRNLLGPHSGSPITAEGELVASADDEEILEEAQAIANYAIMGNYHKRILHE